MFKTPDNAEQPVYEQFAIIKTVSTRPTQTAPQLHFVCLQEVKSRIFCTTQLHQSYMKEGQKGRSVDGKEKKLLAYAWRWKNGFSNILDLLGSVFLTLIYSWEHGHKQEEPSIT